MMNVLAWNNIEVALPLLLTEIQILCQKFNSLLELMLHEITTPTTISECRAGKQTNIRCLFDLRYIYCIT